MIRNLLIVPLVLATGLAEAKTGDELLSALDEAMNRAEDQFFAYDVVDQAPGKDERVLAMEVSMKGDKRLTRFMAPADIKGTKVLIVSQTQMYIYLPAYKKVRRIASHVTSQGFMGTVYSSDDMALSTFADKYTGKMLEDGEKTWTVEAVAKKGGDAPYPKLRITVDKKLVLPTELQYFSDDDKHLKTETRDDYGCEGTVCTARVHKMVDHSSNGHWTKLVRREWKVNGGIKDRVFTKRALARGR